MIAGAGGFGNAWERNVDLVLVDVRDGKVTIGGARAHYGVAIDPETLRVNEEETSILRSKLAGSTSQ